MEKYIQEFIENIENTGIDSETAIVYGHMWINIETFGCSYGEIDKEIKKYIPLSYLMNKDL